MTRLHSTLLQLLVVVLASLSLMLSESQAEVYTKQLVPLDELIPSDVQERIRARKVRQKEWAEQDFSGGGARAGIDLRSRDTSVKKQYGGRCTTYGLLAAMENVLGDRTDLSEEHSWSKYKKYSVQAALSALSNSGVVDEAYWPERNRKPFRGYKDQYWHKLTQSTYLEDDVNRALDALDRGHPVYIGLSTPTEMYECREQVKPDSPLLAKSGHAVAIVGYRMDPAPGAGGGHFLIKNSWGDTCGDRGYQWLPFSLCQRSDMYCLMWEISGVQKY